MISAFARGALVLGEPRYAQQAERAASMLLERLRGEDGRLRRSYAEGEADHNAYLEDYAFLIAGLLDLYEATAGARWVREALALQRTLDAHYADGERGGYFQTSDDHEELLARSKPSSDGAVPSGNSVALLNLLRLAEITGDDAWRERAERGLSAFASILRHRPTAAPAMLGALDWYLDVPLEIVLVSPDERGSDAEPLRAALRRVFVPNRLIATLSEQEAAAQSSLVPVLEGKVAIDGEATAYVCERGRCELPTREPEELARQIARVRPLDPERTPPPLSIPTPGEQPEPWHYDATTDRHWHPDHRHWHDGRPPAAGDR
jgi:hypothetical protein